MITNIDSDGRILLPLAIRYGLHLQPGDRIAVDQLGDGTIILKKIEDGATLDVADASKYSILQLTHINDSGKLAARPINDDGLVVVSPRAVE